MAKTVTRLRCFDLFDTVLANITVVSMDPRRATGMGSTRMASWLTLQDLWTSQEKVEGKQEAEADQAPKVVGNYG